ncbi:MAG: pilus assembly protein [Devosia nanyangense]|uniref:Pilus assembly protein n=1 Tax=Devosia nanyangense TaxID=1228055 RepID=A0A933KZH1_9HYPH|nr:pilus assembly protein [Devosia nanyangense]
MIRTLAQRFAETIRRFRSEERAVAAVEFALIVPFLMTLYFGSMEASALFTADRRVNTISATMGDLVSQWDDDDGAIPAATMTDYFAASQSLIFPMSTTGLKQVITCVQVNADGTTKVIWSRGFGGGVARTVNATYPLAATTMMNQVARGGYLIASEVYYPYLPLLAQVFTSSVNLYHENLYLPRFGALISAA